MEKSYQVQHGLAKVCLFHIVLTASYHETVD